MLRRHRLPLHQRRHMRRHRPPPGCVTIAFAAQKWSEREAGYAQEIAQLRAMLPPSDASDMASEASPSESADVDLLDPLDDSAWGKVEGAKRHKLLGRKRDELARNVRTRLSSVPPAASPFGKA